MKIFESFRNAANKYGETLAREMLRVGIPDKYIRPCLCPFAK